MCIKWDAARDAPESQMIFPVFLQNSENYWSFGEKKKLRELKKKSALSEQFWIKALEETADGVDCRKV